LEFPQSIFKNINNKINEVITLIIPTVKEIKRGEKYLYFINNSNK
jgi:hypothetical protein